MTDPEVLAAHPDYPELLRRFIAVTPGLMLLKAQSDLTYALAERLFGPDATRYIIVHWKPGNLDALCAADGRFGRLSSAGGLTPQHLELAWKQAQAAYEQQAGRPKP